MGRVGHPLSFSKQALGSEDLAVFVQGQPQEPQAWARTVPLVPTNHSGGTAPIFLKILRGVDNNSNLEG